ncbi:uncharacterized protein LOC135931256 [Gordionus sp. m RMFG-2023]|uniref:uncharacterized protein LOC135931256 n=1 Tax=Gordionus sp. m RMFG-2023 TaxID=3053472 RepID=UPI0031FE04DC
MNPRSSLGIFVISLIILFLSLTKSIICKDKKFTNPKTDKILLRNLDVNRIEIGKCRSHCLNQLSTSIGNDSHHDNMMMCWDFCEMLYIQPIWKNVCIESSICFSGCHTSCDFVSKHTKLNPLKFIDGRNYKNGALKIEFESKKYSHNNSQCLHWNLIEESAKSIVYIVFRKNFRKWEEVEQTTLNEYCEKGDTKDTNPKYLVVAVTETDILALDINRYKFDETSLSNVIENDDNHYISKLIDDSLKIEISTKRKRSAPRRYENTLPNTDINIKCLKRNIIMETFVIVFLTMSLIIVTFYIWVLVRHKEPNVNVIISQPPVNFKNGLNESTKEHITNARKFVKLTHILTLNLIDKMSLKNYVSRLRTSKSTKPFYV